MLPTRISAPQPTIPFRSFTIILRNAPTVFIHEPDVTLLVRTSLLGSQAIPLHGLLIILEHQTVLVRVRVYAAPRISLLGSGRYHFAASPASCERRDRSYMAPRLYCPRISLLHGQRYIPASPASAERRYRSDTWLEAAAARISLFSDKRYHFTASLIILRNTRPFSYMAPRLNCASAYRGRDASFSSAVT